MITLQWSETALEFLHEDIPGSENMVPVFSIHNGEHNWKRMLALYSSSTKKFHWASNSGCECCEEVNSQVKSTEAMTSGNEMELKRAVRNFLTHTPDIVTDEEKQKLFSKIKKQK
jgi:hypothetical protein